MRRWTMRLRPDERTVGWAFPSRERTLTHTLETCPAENNDQNRKRGLGQLRARMTRSDEMGSGGGNGGCAIIHEDAWTVGDGAACRALKSTACAAAICASWLFSLSDREDKCQWEDSSNDDDA